MGKIPELNATILVGIQRASNMLRRIDRHTGERTVGRRHADAVACAQACGLTIDSVDSERVHPFIKAVVAG